MSGPRPKEDKVSSPRSTSRQVAQHISVVEDWGRGVRQQLDQIGFRHHQIIDQMHDGHVFIIPDGPIGYVNPAACRILEIESALLLGHWLDDILDLPTADVAELEPTELTYVTPGGVKKILNVRCMPVRLGTDKICWFDFTLDDITERRRQAEMFRIQSAMLDQLGESVALIGNNNRFLYCNKQMAQEWGFTQAEIVGLTPEDVWGHDVVEDMRKRLFDGLAIAGRVGGELKARNKYGKELTVEYTVVEVFDPQGGSIGRIATSHDISERRRMELLLAEQENQLSIILENVPAAMALFDRSGQIDYVNQMAADFMGFDRGELIGRRLSDLMPTEEILAFEQKLQEIMASGQPYQENFVPYHTDGRPVRINVKYVPKLGRDGIVSGVLTMNSDVTKEWDALQSMRKSKKEAELANRSKSEFLANMSHELRTPLNAIIGFSELLVSRLYGPLNKKQHEYCRDIHQSGAHLLSIINQILDLSKIEAGRLELEEIPIDMAQAIDDCLAIVQMRARERELTVSCDIPNEFAHVMADALAVKQVLLNLLSNAVKFSRSQGHIEISGEMLQTGELAIHVADIGVGISPDEIGVLFEPFQQGEAGKSRQLGGTGLGLSICKRLMELHGGSIRLESTKGQGTTATICFPANRVLVS